MGVPPGFQAKPPPGFTEPTTSMSSILDNGTLTSPPIFNAGSRRDTSRRPTVESTTVTSSSTSSKKKFMSVEELEKQLYANKLSSGAANVQTPSVAAGGPLFNDPSILSISKRPVTNESLVPIEGEAKGQKVNSLFSALLQSTNSASQEGIIHGMATKASQTRPSPLMLMDGLMSSGDIQHVQRVRNVPLLSMDAKIEDYYYQAYTTQYHARRQDDLKKTREKNDLTATRMNSISGTANEAMKKDPLYLPFLPLPMTNYGKGTQRQQYLNTHSNQFNKNSGSSFRPSNCNHFIKVL